MWNIKAIIHFRNRNNKKVHRFTNNLQGLQKVVVKDFSWKIIPWNALLFEKTLKQLSILNNENYGLIVNTCHETANLAEQGWVFPLFSPDSDDQLSLNFHRFVVLYISCDTQSVGRGQHCLPKVSIGFKTLITTNLAGRLWRQSTM